MSSIKYNGDHVNVGVSSLYNICEKFPSISEKVRGATNKLLSAKGFKQCVCDISSDTFSMIVDNCHNEGLDLVKSIRQKQVSILGYNQDDNEIQEFLKDINASEYRSLDLSPIQSHISLGTKASNAFDGVNGSLVNFGVGLVEGFGKFGETIYDLCDIASTGARSLFSSQKEIDQMWEECKARVSTEHVKSYFDEMYAENQFLNDARKNAYGGEIGREMGKGLGYAAGMIGLNVLSGGIASPGVGLVGFGAKAGQLAAISSAMGFSKHTEEAWKDGATVSGGLKYGAVAGAWEGVQWYLGAKINAIGGTAKAGEILRGGSKAVASRIGLSSVDAGMEGIINPALKTLYKNYGFDSFGENFKAAYLEAGGAANIFKSAAMGAIGATFGEMVEAGKSYAALKSNKNVDYQYMKSGSKNADNLTNKSAEISAEVAATEKAVEAFKQKYPELVSKYGEDFVDTIPVSELKELNEWENVQALNVASKILNKDLGDPFESELDGGLILSAGYKDDIVRWLRNDVSYYESDVEDVADTIASQAFASTNVTKIRANHLALSGDISGAFDLIPKSGVIGSEGGRFSINTRAAADMFRSLETYGTYDDTKKYAVDLCKYVNDNGSFGVDDAGKRVKNIYESASFSRGFTNKYFELDGREICVTIPNNFRISSTQNMSPDDFIQELSNLDEGIRGYLPTDITLSDSFSILDITDSTSEGKLPELDGNITLGYCKRDSGEIVIFAHSTKNDNIMETITHEVGHNFDKAINGKLGDFSKSPEWEQAVLDDKSISGYEYVSGYAKWYATEGEGVSNGFKFAEDFAESVRGFLCSPDTFKEEYPNRTKLIKEWLAKYKKVGG